MPDDVIPGYAMPGTWHGAFAALPQETPPAQGWDRLAARMDVDARQIARKARSYARAPAWIGLAVAATFAVVMVWPRHEAPAPTVEPSHARLACSAEPCSAERSMAPLYRNNEPTQPTARAASAAITKPADRRKPDVRIAADAAPTKPASTKSAPTKMPVEPSHARLASGPETTQRSMAPLYNLYAESAQLEALLTLARDDRVSSAGAALLSDELDAQVAAIDASLAQPDLDDDERLRLWQARVDALRQAAGFESTQRLLASQGRSDVMLVSVD
jgi:hypothetical protein